MWLINSTLNIRLWIILSVLICSQFSPLSAAKQDIINLDYCRFKGDFEKSYVELYLEIPRSSITHVLDTAGWFGSVRFISTIYRNDSLLTTDNWSIADHPQSPEQISGGQKIVDARIYHLRPGNYNFHVSGVDSISGANWYSTINLKTESFAHNKVEMSDIEISSNLIPPDILPKFDRDGFGIVPQLQRLFGLENPFFIYYVEIYPPAEGFESNTLLFEHRIIDGYNQVVQEYSKILPVNDHQAFSELDSIRLDSLTTGSYTFTIELSDTDGYSIERSRRFFIYRPDLAFDKPQIPLDSATIADEINRIEFLLTRDEFSRTQNMPMTEQAQFLEEFWRQYAGIRGSSASGIRAQFRERVDEADRRYSNSRSAGHKTDRGRVYVLYGEPENRETRPMDLNNKPHEIWNYDKIEGGVIFVFVDRSGFGEYSLVHSSKRGEIYNSDWFNLYVLRSSTSTVK